MEHQSKILSSISKNNAAQTIQMLELAKAENSAADVDRFLQEEVISKVLDSENGNDQEKLKLIDQLANEGVDFNKAQETGMTPLEIALENGDLEAMQVLLTHRADPNTLISDKSTLLMRASELQNTEAMNLLIKNKADLNLRDAEGKNVLVRAVENKDADSIKFLVKQDVTLSAKDKTDLKNALQTYTPKEKKELGNSVAKLSL